MYSLNQGKTFLHLTEEQTDHGNAKINSRKMKYDRLRNLYIILLFFLTAFPAFSADSELTGFFSMDTFLAGRNTPARYLTDHILSREHEILIKNLDSKIPEKRQYALRTLTCRRNAIRNALTWKIHPASIDLPWCEVFPSNATSAGNTLLWRGAYRSHPVCSLEHLNDGSLWFGAHNDTHIWLAGSFIASNCRENVRYPWMGDSFEIFLLAPGNGWRYYEFILTPKRGLVLLKQLNYSGTGTRFEIPDCGLMRDRVRVNAMQTENGFFTAIAIPKKLCEISDGAIRFMLVRTCAPDGTQRTPVPNATEGHNIFGFVNGKLKSQSVDGISHFSRKG